MIHTVIHVESKFDRWSDWSYPVLDSYIWWIPPNASKNRTIRVVEVDISIVPAGSWTGYEVHLVNNRFTRAKEPRVILSGSAKTQVERNVLLTILRMVVKRASWSG